MREVASRTVPVVNPPAARRGATTWQPPAGADPHPPRAQPRAARAPAAARARRLPLPRALERGRRDPGAVRAVDVRRAVVAARGLRARRADRGARARAASSRRRCMRATIHLVSRADFWPFALATRAARRGAVAARGARRADAPAAMAGAARTLRRRLGAARRSRRKEVEALLGKPRAAASACGSTSSACRRRAPGSAGGRTSTRAAEDWLGPPDVTPAAATEHLVRRYLGGFGPASRKDVASFTGHRADRARARRSTGSSCGASRARTARSCSTCPARPLPDPATPAPPRFLPTWDATLLVHARRTGVLPEEHRPKIFNTQARTRSRRSSSTARSPARGATRRARSRSSRSRRSTPPHGARCARRRDRLAAFHA